MLCAHSSNGSSSSDFGDEDPGPGGADLPHPVAANGLRCNDSTVDEHHAAQAMELVRALCDQLHEMTGQLSRLERQGVTGRNGRASAIRYEPAALRRDIGEAQILIDRLERRYLNGQGHASPVRTAVADLSKAARRW